VDYLDDLQLWISQREGKIPIEVLYLPRPASKYKGCYPMWFEKHLPRLLETDNYVHFFAGTATTGFRVDRLAELKPDMVGDVEKIPALKSNSFDGGMADPPYTKEFAETLYNCKYPEWGKWTRELVRVVKPNGLIGVMHNYPVPQMAGCKWAKLVVIIQRIKQYPKIVTIQRKL